MNIIQKIIQALRQPLQSKLDKAQESIRDYKATNIELMDDLASEQQTNVSLSFQIAQLEELNTDLENYLTDFEAIKNIVGEKTLKELLDMHNK